MDDISEQDRAALVALLDRALRHEARMDAPPKAERDGWLYDASEMSEPDENGWMTTVPTEPKWVPRALVFWRMAALAGVPAGEEYRRDPRHSLARWPAIEEAVSRAFGMAGAAELRENGRELAETQG